MITGKVLMEKDGAMVVLSAPLIFVGEPGRKTGYVLETVVWQNVYATDETDIDKLESIYLEKSDTWVDYDVPQKKFRNALCEVDRQDFTQMLTQLGTDAETVQAQSENVSDIIDMPHGWAAATSIRKSDIAGNGLFLSWPVTSGSVIAPARINGKRTPAGRYVNHAATPNCIYKQTEDGDIYLIAKRNIAGCQGGSAGEELTVDYRQANALLKVEALSCQE